MAGCRSRCPECRCVCTANHIPGDGEGQVGQVHLAPIRINEKGYEQVQHGHIAGHSRRTGFHAHAWWVRPTSKAANAPVRPRIILEVENGA